MEARKGGAGEGGRGLGRDVGLQIERYTQFVLKNENSSRMSSGGWAVGKGVAGEQPRRVDMMANSSLDDEALVITHSFPRPIWSSGRHEG
jgi:hypothetical protein